MEKPTLIVSFVRRYWPLLIIFVALVILGRIDQVTYLVGPIFYLIEMMVACMVAAAFAKHIFWRSTIDAYTEDDVDGHSQFFKEWNALNPDLRVVLTLFIMAVLFIGAALIGASIAK